MSQVRDDLSGRLAPHLRDCRLCPRDCRTDRAAGGLGFCGAAIEGRCFASFVHFFEEARLVPSFVISFTGCNMRCAFCANHDAVRLPHLGSTIDPAFFRSEIERYARLGVTTVNLMGGEPACNIFAIASIFDDFDCPLPVIWNSNLYFSPVLRDVVSNVADIFLADLKFGNDQCAVRLASAPRYSQTVRDNILALAPGADMIVRHLLMPGHFDCCTIPVFDWVAEHLPGVDVSLLGNFFPPRSTTCPELTRAITRDEYSRAAACARERGLHVIS
mgnify:CR=1 FL=1